MIRLIFIFFIVFLVETRWTKAQYRVSLKSELRQLSDLSLLPAYRTGTQMGQSSSYDQSGGNDDGTDKYLKRDINGDMILLDVDGPGVLSRIWTPTPTKDTLDFFIDGKAKPVLSICYDDLFTGKSYPFVAPLCGNAVGGYFAYFPVLFQKHLKLVCRAKHLRYQQQTYRLFPKGTKVQSFALPLNPSDQQALEQVGTQWNQIETTGKPVTAQLTLPPGEVKTLFSFNKGGRITGLEIDTTGTQNLRLRISWDKETMPAIDCPFRNFFGYAFGKASMQGLLSGTSAVHYAYFPMPFDQSAKIELVNEGKDPVTVRAKINFESKKRNAKSEGRFYANYVHEELTENDPFHVFLDIKGKGHYIGTILQTIGKAKGMTRYFEGDDITKIDSTITINGTGSEDYFNGGWYDLQGRWDHVQSMPLSGCLGYSREPIAHTAGYRFFISDKTSFEKNFWHGIEHGNDAQHGKLAEYTSVSFYYCDHDKAAQQLNK